MPVFGGWGPNSHILRPHCVIKKTEAFLGLLSHIAHGLIRIIRDLPVNVTVLGGRETVPRGPPLPGSGVGPPAQTKHHWKQKASRIV